MFNLPVGSTREFVEAVTPAKECDCGHLESQHADEDYDCVGDPPRYVACRRPCSKCDCRNYFEP